MPDIFNHLFVEISAHMIGLHTIAKGCSAKLFVWHLRLRSALQGPSHESFAVRLMNLADDYGTDDAGPRRLLGTQLSTATTRRRVRAP